MRAKFKLLQQQGWLLPLIIVTLGAISWLMLYRLGSLVGGMSNAEHQVAATVYGWHGLWQQPLNLPLGLVRSTVFSIFRHHGQTLTRLPNVLFGALTIITFASLLRLWYGGRTAFLAAALFSCAAWTLHVSRLASNDVLYLWGLPLLLLTQIALQRRGSQVLIFYICLMVWLGLLFVPGLVYVVLLTALWSWRPWWQAWRQSLTWWQRGLAVTISLALLSYLAIALTRPGNWRLWLGLPAHFTTPLKLLRQFAAVPFHLFVRGPANPALWLGRAPLLDVFSLAMAAIGIYFYARHWQAGRSRQLASFFLVGWVLVSLGGPVGLSLLVPLLYLCIAAGMAYLLREWLQVFPFNPLARSVGIGLIMVAVALSAGYNLRAFFVAWPHDPTTQTTFHYKVE